MTQADNWRERLQVRLARLMERTAEASKLSQLAYWVGDVAGERRVRDDFASGRASWREANRAAQLGLDAIAEDNREMAETCAWVATDHYINALEIRLNPYSRQLLQRSAKRRGRPPKKVQK